VSIKNKRSVPSANGIISAHVEVLVAFDSDHIPGLMRLAGMQQELGEILGCQVKIKTAQDLSRYYWQQHLDSVASEEGEFAKELRGPWRYFL
jgi:hypothetical protein